MRKEARVMKKGISNGAGAAGARSDSRHVGIAARYADAVDAAAQSAAGGTVGSAVGCTANAARHAAKRSGFKVMMKLIGLVKPLTGYMILAILMGLAGHLCATFITVFGGYAVLNILQSGGAFGAAAAGAGTAAVSADAAAATPLAAIFACLVVFALIRGFLRYAEQACNHYIAFKLLALIRDKIFGALRKLCPAKLEGRDKGELINVITSDIELLEVFYAHTISPVCIATIFSLLMTAFIGAHNWALGILAAASYGIVGIAIPLITSHCSGDDGMNFRAKSGELAGFVLDSLRGLPEIQQYGQGEKRLDQMNHQTDSLAKDEERMKRTAGRNTAVTNAVILVCDIAMLIASAYLCDFEVSLICTLALMSSFGPCVALAALGSTLQNTLAAGNRVLDILEESPVVEEVAGRTEVTFTGATVSHITFAYDSLGAESPDAGSAAAGASAATAVCGSPTPSSAAAAGTGDLGAAPAASAIDASVETTVCDSPTPAGAILDDFSLEIPENQIIGIVGQSGSGKSTLLKLLMRFWKVQQGEIKISDRSIESVNTANLRDMESFVTQETHLFHDSIRNNLRIAKLDATDEEIISACRKASVHDFIMTLPKGYDTPVGELGDTLSGGERQRLGMARAFLHDAPFMLLDEPTSNLDSLNEAVILKSLSEERHGKTVVLVSHRKSTMGIADKSYCVENGRMS